MQKADLVLEGGGVKGIGLVGAIRALADAGYEPARVAGTSAGAVAGCMVAAGMGVDELETVMRELDYRNFEDRTVLDHLWLPGVGLNLLLHKGIYKGDALHDFVDSQLRALGRRTWGELKITDDPDSALPDNQRYRLVVIVSDVSDNRMLRLPWDYGLLGVGPQQVDELPVADAVRASASIPFFFEPCELEVSGRGGKLYLTDGGMLSNFPIDVFDRHDDRRPRWPTLGVKLSARPEANTSAPPPPQIRGPVELAMALVATLCNAHDQMHLDQLSVVDRTIFVDTLHVKATDFHLDKETREKLFTNGLEAGQKFLSTWDFDHYLDSYWKPEHDE